MAYTTAYLIEQFRLTVPAMSDVTDEELTSDFDVYAPYLNEKAFGTMYPKALCYFVAHMRTLNNMIMVAVQSGGTAGDPSFLAGALTGEREGDLQRTYAALSTSSTNEGNMVLMKTMYGQLFLQLRRMCIIPVTIRHGGCYGRY